MMYALLLVATLQAEMIKLVLALTCNYFKELKKFHPHMCVFMSRYINSRRSALKTDRFRDKASKLVYLSALLPHSKVSKDHLFWNHRLCSSV